MAEDGPCDAAVLELLSGDFTGEGTVGLVVDVLSGDLKALAEVLAGQEEVERRGSNDNLCSLSAWLLPICTQKDLPALGSSLASFRFWTIFLMDSIEPFLQCNQSSVRRNLRCLLTS